VTEAKLASSSVTAAKIGTDAVTTAKIQDNAVTQAKLADRVVGSAEYSNLTLNAQTGTTYTLVLSDAHKVVTLNNASPIALTVPTNASVAFSVGDQISLVQTGAGQVTVAGAGGVTVNSTPGLKLRAQWSGSTLLKTAENSWVLFGDLSA
jgi:Na+-translocating ferredoxin:NAD+ oxidoreductase RnfG subunit